MGKWSNLTPQQKATVIKFAIDNGVSDINKIRDTFNVYAIDNGVENEYKEGGNIHIKPSKRGTFTAAATKYGKSVRAFASQVLAHKENYSPAMVRKAVFAHNAASWKHSTGGPLYPFSFSGHIPAVRYDEGGEFLPNETLQHVQLWLNQGTKFQKKRPGTVNTQNITSALDPNGPDNQYIWDDDSHTSYSAFRRNPDYRAPVVPSVQVGPQALQTVPADASKIAITAKLPKPRPVAMSALPIGWSRTTATQNLIQTAAEYNPAFGYEIYHLDNTPKYGIKYYSIPGAANAGEGHYAILDSAAMGIPIQELNRRIYDYRTNHGGWNSFNPVD